MQPEPERDQPFTRMVARVGKLDVDVVPLATTVCCYHCRQPPRSEFRHRSAQITALPTSVAVSNKRIRVDRTPDGNFAAVLIDGPRPNRLSVRETRSPLDEKPTEDAETSMRVLDEQETETAVPAKKRHSPS